MRLDKKTAKMWSRMGPRAVYGRIMTTLAKENENLLLMSADLGRSSGLASFYANQPERFINTGIAEQNMVGVAAGLTRLNYQVFASTFAPFASMRAAEQVRMNLGYMQEPVKLVGLGSGVSMAFLGNSHFGLEDVAVMRTIPNLTIISPADCIELAVVLRFLVNYPKPCYVRLTGAVNAPVVYEQDFEFKLGDPQWIREKSNNNVIATGTTVGYAKNALDSLAEQGVELGLINQSTLKPINEDKLVSFIEGSKCLYVLEEHTKVGGLYSVICDLIVRYKLSGIEVISRALPDSYLETGEYEYLLDLYGLDAKGIKELITNNMVA